MPQWHEFLATGQGRFRRPEGGEALERYLTGLLPELPTKNGDTMAQSVPGTREQRGHELIAEATRGDGVWLFDDPGFPKKGRASVGVKWQYSGPLGQVGHGQIAVTCCATERHATGPVAVWLYVPKTWADAPERRQQARVPAEIALALPEQARAWGVPQRGGVADAGDGDHPTFLAGVEARQEPEVVGVQSDFPGSLRRAALRQVWRADELLQTVPRWPWRTIRWRRGTSNGQRHGGWPLGERATRGPPEAR